MDYLPSHQEIKLIQNKNYFCMNTDSCLLGEFYELNDGETLLDIGTNNGVLLLYSLLKGKGILFGVDIFQEAIDLAYKNLELNNLKAKLFCQDVKTLQIAKLDVIISNPPYFVKEQSTLTEKETFLYAKFEYSLSLDDLFSFVSKHLKDKGRFYLVHRYLRRNEIINFALKYNLKVLKEKDVFDQRVNKYIQVLFCFTF